MEIDIDDTKVTYESSNGDIKNDVGIYTILHKLKFGDKIHGISFADAEKIIKFLNYRNRDISSQSDDWLLRNLPKERVYSCFYYKDTMLLVET